jgi:hypothetical protein
MNKVTAEELEKIKTQQEKLNSVITNLGVLETRKHAMLHEIAGINKDIETTKVELEESYGSVNINLETGEYTEIKEDVDNKKD